MKKIESYAGVSLIPHILSWSAIITSVESIVESWRSEIENLSSSKPTVTEVGLYDKMMICLNSLVLSHCDTIVDKALDYLKSDYKNARDRVAGHFIRRSEDFESYTVSEVVDRINSTKMKLPFIM